MFLAIITVEPVAFVTMFAVSLEYAIMQDLLFTKLCMEKLDTVNPHLCLKAHLSNETIKELSREQALSMRYYLALLYFPAIVTTLYAGSWSDYFGRKKPMSIPFVFSIVAQISFLCCSIFIQKNLIGLIFLSGLLSGISGGVTNVLANAFGYISDITTDENRTKRIIVLEAMFYLGGFLGYNAAGALMQYVIGQHYEVAFIITLCLYVVVLIYIAVRIEETREQLSGSLAMIFSCAHLLNTFRVVFRARNRGRARRMICLLCVCSAVSILPQSVLTGLLYSYVKDAPLYWNRSLYSYYSAFSYAVNGISLVIILPLLLKFWKHCISDTVIGILGFTSKALGLCALGLAKTTEVMFLCPILLVFNEYTMPSVRAMISKIVDENEKGKAFAVLASMQNLLQFFGSIIFTSLYSATIHTFPGLSFEVVAGAQLIAVIIFAYLHRINKPDEEERIIRTT